jgi:hypothetical protein
VRTCTRYDLATEDIHVQSAALPDDDVDEFLYDFRHLTHDGGSDGDQLWDSPLEPETRPAHENPPNCELEAHITASPDTCRPDPEWT